MIGSAGKVVSLVLAILLLGGCAVHRQQAIAPKGPLPGTFKEQSGPTAEEMPIGRWWETFGDVKLNGLMEEAFSGNLDIEVAFARLDQLQAVTRQTASVRYPSLNVEGEAGRSGRPGIFGDDTGNSYSLSLAAGYEVDLWSKRKAGTLAASLDAEATREDVRALYISLSARLVDLYYLAVEQRAQIQLTDSTIASFADTLERVTWRYTQGLVPALDVYQARQNLAFARASRPVFEANLAEAEHAIAIILGRYPETDLAGDLAKFPETPAAFPAGIPSRVLMARPDVRAEFLRVEASDARVAEAIADRFPSFNLLGSYGTSKTAFSSGDITGVFWSLFGSLTLPVIDGGRRRAEVDRTEAAFRESLARYRGKVLAAVSEVEDALVKNRTTEERIELLNEQVDATEGSLRLSLERYLLGISDYLPVLSAQGAHFRVKSQLLAARRQLISDRVSLARALGGNWMDEEMGDRLRVENEGGSEQ